MEYYDLFLQVTASSRKIYELVVPVQQKPMAKHLKACNATITCDDFEVLASTSRGQDYLETLEALYIREINPKINTKDEYRSKELTIKLVP